MSHETVPCGPPFAILLCMLILLALAVTLVASHHAFSPVYDAKTIDVEVW